MMNTVAPGGAFKGASQSGHYNHTHASAMGHAAANRLKLARALGGAGPAAVAPPAQLAGPQPPQGMPAGRPKHSYKAHVAIQTAKQGVVAGIPDIHAAIDKLAQKGRITPFQAQALKTHNGPLEGPKGHATVHAIAQQVVNPSM